MKNRFYLALPEESSVGFHQNNAVPRFVLKLPEYIRLGDNKMALVSIIYPHS
jgi:hypothetical protein